jgi:DNA-binding response OmpR family regulator
MAIISENSQRAKTLKSGKRWRGLELKKRPLILVVDDYKPLRKVLKVNLSLEGYSIVMASDGKSALSLSQKYEPDLIILDIMMPGLDGFQVLDKIRQHSNVPIIMLTARDEILSLAHGLCNGADDYIRKPFDMLELTSRIRARLRGNSREFCVESPSI